MRGFRGGFPGMAAAARFAPPFVVAWLVLMAPAVAAAQATRTAGFAESGEAFANPLKGWVVWAENHIEPPQPATMFFSYRSWRQLEPEKGVYDFESWENGVWDFWVRRGMKGVLRVYLDYPGRPVGVPQWLLDEGVGVTEYEQFGGGVSPDYENPILRENAKRLIAKLGERYNNDPRVGFLDVGILGHWGEWHTYPTDNLFASLGVQREVTKAFAEAFPDKKMMLRYPTSWTAKMPFGYRDDCFYTDTDGPEDWKFFSRFASAGAMDIWKTQPIGGEFCGGGQGAIDATLEGPEECLRLIREGHFSHLGPAGGTMEARDEAHQATIGAMLRTMGYRFVIRSAELPARLEPGAAAEIAFTVENTGSAPFYYPWPLECVWMDESGQEIGWTRTDIDIREWLPGVHEAKARAEAPAGRQGDALRFGLSIPDPSGLGPAIRFANEEETRNGVFTLGTVEITAQTGMADWNSHEPAERGS